MQKGNRAQNESDSFGDFLSRHLAKRHKKGRKEKYKNSRSYSRGGPSTSAALSPSQELRVVR